MRVMRVMRVIEMEMEMENKMKVMKVIEMENKMKAIEMENKMKCISALMRLVSIRGGCSNWTWTPPSSSRRK